MAGHLTSKKAEAWYTGDVGEPVRKIDKPEPRWQVVLALLAVGGIYVALPRALIAGPKWVLPILIAVLIAPTVVAHRMGKHSLNRRLDDQFDLRSNRRTFARPVGKDSHHGPDRNLINDCDCFDFARGRSALMAL